MEGYIEWSDIPEDESSKTQDKPEYLWLKSGNKYRVRPVHLAVPVFKYFHRDKNGKLRTAICADPGSCTVLQNHPELNKPSRRYAIYVVDREDGKLKIMEGPKSVFFPFKKRFQATGKKSGSSQDGGDWQVEVNGSGQKNTTYEMIYLEDTPLNDEEKGMVNAVLNDEKRLLTTVYKVHSPEQIEKRLFADYENKGNNNEAGSNTVFTENTTSVPSTSPTSPASPASTGTTGTTGTTADSDDFNW